LRKEVEGAKAKKMYLVKELERGQRDVMKKEEEKEGRKF
jgi:hypothetical protein